MEPTRSAISTVTVRLADSQHVHVRGRVGHAPPLVGKRFTVLVSKVLPAAVLALVLDVGTGVGVSTAPVIAEHISDHSGAAGAAREQDLPGQSGKGAGSR